ncbi:unnamed protein product [Rotaria sp. Silwood1]|nr:unnamed protein product [Rotaria sp. Silwood1]CAF3784604.1 unnamed protein product [Rotaria sp. Silwood1]CAF4958180.1 unnamed protein product [Rotaria sp. Silwood1]
MSSKKRDNDDDDVVSYKKPFAVSQLTIAMLFTTYFLTVEIIELSLSTYVLQQNKLEVYQQYLLFKSQAPIWKYWRILTLIILPITIFINIQNLFQILTKKATIQRHLLDVISAFQLFGILYTIIVRLMPLETRFMKSISNDIAQNLNSIHQTAFMLNILGWFIPIFRYRESKNDMYYHLIKKTR